MGKKEKAPCLRFKDTNGKDYPAWEQRELCEVAKVTMGQSPRGENYTSDPNDKILIQGNADLRNGWVCPRVWTKEVTKTCNKGDIIFSVRAPVGDVGKTAYDAVIGRGVASIKGSDFVFQTLQYLKQKGYWTKVSAGSTFDSVNSDTLRKTLIQIPIDPQEQAKIGEFFSSLDGAITLHQRKLETLKKLKRTLLQKMFPKKGQLKPELRFPGFTNDWEQRKLGDFAEKVTEKNTELRYSEVFTNSAEFGVIRQRDFFDHDIAQLRSLHGYYVVKEDDFVYNPRISVTAPVGPINRNKLGKTGVVSPLYTVLRTQGINREFLEWFFKSSCWYPFMLFNGDSGARSDRFSIKNALFFRMPIALPCQAEQMKIGLFFERLDKAITLHQRKLETYKKLKKSLLQKMFI